LLRPSLVNRLLPPPLPKGRGGCGPPLTNPRPRLDLSPVEGVTAYFFPRRLLLPYPPHCAFSRSVLLPITERAGIARSLLLGIIRISPPSVFFFFLAERLPARHSRSDAGSTTAFTASPTFRDFPSSLKAASFFSARDSQSPIVVFFLKVFSFHFVPNRAGGRYRG